MMLTQSSGTARAVTVTTVRTVGSNAAVVLVAAPGAGLKLRVLYFEVSIEVLGAAANFGVRDGSGGTDKYLRWLTAVGTFVGHNIRPDRWEMTANTALYSSVIPNGVTVTYTVETDTVAG